MAETPAEKRTSQDPAVPVLHEEAWLLVRGKRSHESDIPSSPDSNKLFSSPQPLIDRFMAYLTSSDGGGGEKPVSAYLEV